MTGRSRLQALVIITLLAIIVVFSLIAWAKYSQSQPVEISLPQGQEMRGEILVEGAVNNPGYYPYTDGDSLAAIIRDAGGATGSADLNRLRLHVVAPGEDTQPQKVSLNRAEAWLLQALPGIGETRAKAIIDYRTRHGAFRDTAEILKVDGISTAVYDRIKDLITVD